MAATIISVTFEVDAQNHKDGQFSVPKAVCSILGLDAGEDITVIIESSASKPKIATKLASGTEIYGSEIAQYVKAGQRIRVTASRSS